MLLRAVIIDDEQRGINTLKILIGKYISDVKVVAECTSPQAGIELIEDYKPEIVFLDIQMPEMSGFDLLEKLKWRSFHLVFTTAYQEYALRAIKANTLDYLLKPIDYRDLQQTIEKIRKRISDQEYQLEAEYQKLIQALQQTHQKKIVVNSKTGIESFELSEIVFFESRSNYTQIHLSGGKDVVTSKVLKEYDTQLCSSQAGFMRVHNSFIINLEKVSRYLKETQTIVMNTGHQIPLAKSRKDVFFDWLSI